MSKKSSIIMLFKEALAAKTITTRLLSLDFINNYSVFKITPGNNRISNNDIISNDSDIILNNASGSDTYHFYLTLLSKYNDPSKVNCIILYQYGDDTRSFFLKLINDKTRLSIISQILDLDKVFFSYEGDGEEYEILVDEVEDCIRKNNYSALESCMIYPIMKYRWLFDSNE